MGKKKMIIFSKTLWIVLTSVFAALLVALLIGNNFADYYEASINSFFECKTFEVIDDEFAEEMDTVYYKPKFALAKSEWPEFKEGEKEPLFIADKEKLYAYDKSVALETANEGAVLLWNNGALPLAKTEKINTFGSRSADDYVYVTQGSGGTRLSEHPTIKDALKEEGFTVNEPLWEFYKANGIGCGHSTIDETPWSALDAGTVASISGNAVFVIGRRSGEGSDFKMTNTDGANGNVTALSDDEVSILDGLVSLKNQGKVKKIVVLLNTPPMGVQFDVLSAYKDRIDACMWTGLGGTSGPAAIADLLAGEAIPSGHLTDTLAYSNFSAPSAENMGNLQYTNAQSDYGDTRLWKNQGEQDSQEKNFKYLVYQEGIYVGYKYYETRYEDCVLGAPGAKSPKGVKHGEGDWTYKDEVAYPFGYGMSYTTFAHSDFTCKETGEGFEITVKVTNTGNTYAGKDVVQVYLQKPYETYCKTNGIEQAAVNLVGFAKTSELAPGKSETVAITVDKKELLTYDANKAKTYVTIGGDYYLAAGEDAHDATNNILAAKGKTTASGMDEAGKAAFAKKFTIAANYETAKSVYTGEEITNRFDDVDLNKNSQYGTGKIAYLSRSDWAKTYPSSVTLSCNQALYTDLCYEKAWEEDQFAAMPEYEQQNGLNLFGLWKNTEGEELPYDFELWDQLLDQTTFTEQTYLICNAWCATQALESVAAPATQNRDGPAGLNYLPAPPVIGLGMCYPGEPLMAATWNPELVWKIGECLGEDNLACGFTFLYGPGANIHRSPFSGRNSEYYSEDPFISGIMLEAEIKGLQSNGSGAQIKHYALNDQEVNRNGVCIWANEQSIRELYLKPHEFGCAEGRGEALSVMSSFTRAGAVWAGAHKGMMTDVLRGEWGFKGFVQSDGNGYPLMANYVDGLRAGNDIFMCGGGKRALDKYKDSPEIALAMREATHRVLYALTRTHAMNGLNSSTRVITITPWWRHALLAIDISVGVITGLCAAMLATSVVLYIRRKRSEISALTDIGGNNDEES